MFEADLRKCLKEALNTHTLNLQAAMSNLKGTAGGGKGGVAWHSKFKPDGDQTIIAYFSSVEGQVDCNDLEHKSNKLSQALSVFVCVCASAPNLRTDLSIQTKPAFNVCIITLCVILWC